jgi:CDP-diacylglycerol--serine O-phosphatidyltransferase
MNDDRDPRGIPFRAMIPNAITALALCFGLTGVSLAIRGDWERALGSIILAGVLDGLDGRIARLLRAQSKFGAELDSLSDNIAFGTAPALILFLWSLQTAPRFGWIAALALAVCCALRLARFNARLDAAEPAVVDEMLARGLRGFRDRVLRLALGTDEQHLAAAGSRLLHEVERAREQRHGLRQIDDVHPVAVAEDVRLHLGVPAMSLVAEMRSGLEQLLHGDDRGRHNHSPSGSASGKR